MHSILLAFAVLAFFGDDRSARGASSRWAPARLANDDHAAKTKASATRAGALDGSAQVYETAQRAVGSDYGPLAPAVPAGAAAAIKAVDDLHRSIRSNPAIAQWQLETVRSRY